MQVLRCIESQERKLSKSIHSYSAKSSRLSTLIDPSYNLAAGNAVLGTIFGGLENLKVKLGKIFGVGAISFTLFGGFIAYQTSTLSFKFDEDSFALVRTTDESSIGENVVVGGENDWKYSTFVYCFFLAQ